jgi:hypothetical protein
MNNNQITVDGYLYTVAKDGQVKVEREDGSVDVVTNYPLGCD